MKKTPSEEFAVYLRKSRADLEAEERGEGETLARHKRHLLALAKRLKFNITDIYHEIVSGDRLSDRPEALRLLNDVEEGRWKGVLVMEVERLARGDTIDQGVVAQAFKRSSTLIVTPNKTYDPTNEFDEEYFEFGLFMARREYKTIKRRLQRGREASASEGNYIGTRPPYGYMLAYNERLERTLVPDPLQADVVRMIFDWYVNGCVDEEGNLIEMGSQKIARKLESISVPTYRKTTEWNFNVVLQILRNEVYIGQIQWKKRVLRKTQTGKKTDAQDKELWINVKGKHEPLVDIEVFTRANVKLAENMSNPVKLGFTIVNPMAGLIFCAKCDRAMVLKKFPKNRIGHSLICQNKNCDCKSSNFEIVEERILDVIKNTIKEYKKTIGKRLTRQDPGLKVQEQLLAMIQGELKLLESQKGSLFDLLERKVYDEATFLERSQNLSMRLQETYMKLEQAEKDLKTKKRHEHERKDFVPTLEKALTEYLKSTNQQRKNVLMKSIISKVLYTKEKSQVGEEFTVDVYIRSM